MVELDKVKQFVGQREGTVEKLFLLPGDLAQNIDLFSDIPDLVLEPLTNVMIYAKETKDEVVWNYCIQLLRNLVSRNRKGRTESITFLAQQQALNRQQEQETKK